MNNNKTLQIQEYELPVTIQAEKEGGFTAVCSLWSACYAQGETVEEVVNEISSVATALIELYKEERMKIPLKLKKTAKANIKKFTLSFPVIVSVN